MYKKGTSAFISFIIALVILIPIIIIVALIYLFGVSSVSSQITSIQSYVTQTELALTYGSSVVVGALAPSFNSNQFMVQFYGTPQCISLLDSLSRDALLQEPNNPATMANQFFICSGTYKSFNFKDPSNGNTLTSEWISIPSGSSKCGETCMVDALPNWVESAEWNPSSNEQGWSPNTYEMNGSEGTMYFENDSLNQNMQTIEQDLGRYCVEFLNATVVPYGPGNPGAYITGMTCIALGTKNNMPVFISLQTNSCNNIQNGCYYDPLIFFHGSPAQIVAQFCNYKSGPSISCLETIK